MTTEIEPVRSNSPELSAMTLPKLKTVATQLGVDGAAKMKKDDLVEAIADLQAKNREAAKAEREARREARNKSKKEAKSSNNSASNEDSDDDGEDSSPQSNTERGNRNERFDRNDRQGGSVLHDVERKCVEEDDAGHMGAPADRELVHPKSLTKPSERQLHESSSGVRGQSGFWVGHAGAVSRHCGAVGP